MSFDWRSVGDGQRVCSPILLCFEVSGSVLKQSPRWLPFQPLVYCLERSESRLVIVDAERAKCILPAVSRLGEGGVAGFLVLDSPRLEPGWVGMQLWSDVMRPQDPAAGSSSPPLLDAVKILPEDDATIFFTSGTYVWFP